MKRQLLFIFICSALISLVGCGAKNTKLEENAQLVVNAFSQSDMSTINRIIFETNDSANAEFNGDFFDDWRDNVGLHQNGFLENVFRRVSVKVNNITDLTIEYEINAPNLTDVFAELKSTSSSLDESELFQYIIDYMDESDRITTRVSLEYIFVDNELYIDYKNEAFINAVTGGLLDAYKSLYSEMINEYEEGVHS